MNTPTPQDPLAALKKSSPDDPIIPAMEHINNHLDTMKSHAKSIARDATSLRNTRKMIFFIACLIRGSFIALLAVPIGDRQLWRGAPLSFVFRSFACSRLSVFALTSPLTAGGLSVVPSEDYSHAPPCYAVFFS